METLIEDLKSWYKDESYPPEGINLDSVWDEENDKWTSKAVPGAETEQVSYEVVDSALRWGNSIVIVYKRGDEFVAVYDVEPATQTQGWGDYGPPEIAAVEPYEVTVTKYRKV